MRNNDRNPLDAAAAIITNSNNAVAPNSISLEELEAFIRNDLGITKKSFEVTDTLMQCYRSNVQKINGAIVLDETNPKFNNLRTVIQGVCNIKHHSNVEKLIHTFKSGFPYQTLDSVMDKFYGNRQTNQVSDSQLSLDAILVRNVVKDAFEEPEVFALTNIDIRGGNKDVVPNGNEYIMLYNGVTDRDVEEAVLSKLDSEGIKPVPVKSFKNYNTISKTENFTFKILNVAKELNQSPDNPNLPICVLMRDNKNQCFEIRIPKETFKSLFGDKTFQNNYLNESLANVQPQQGRGGSSRWN